MDFSCLLVMVIEDVVMLICFDCIVENRLLKGMFIVLILVFKCLVIVVIRLILKLMKVLVLF